MELEVYIIAYADDVSALLVGDSEAVLQRGVDIISTEFLEYFSAAGLSMNPDKSEIISFQSKRTRTQELTVGGQTEAEKVKLLGVVVDTGYKFSSMSKKVAQTMEDRSSKLSKLYPLMSKKRKMMVTEALILSTIDFCIEIWGKNSDVQ